MCDRTTGCDVFPAGTGAVPLLAPVFALVLMGIPGTVSRAAPAAIPPEMATLFPLGRTFTGVKIPSYSGTSLNTVLEADTITRDNKTYLTLTDLVIKIYNAKGGVESTIRMDKAHYYLTSGQLVSQTPARVEHEKFVMTGNQMAFDTTREVSTMTGRVRVVIPEATKFAGDFGKSSISGD